MTVSINSVKKYPVCEANILRARRAGRIYSQYPLSSTDFPVATGTNSTGKAYNGMILAVDFSNQEITKPVTTTSGSATSVNAGQTLGLLLSSETEYENKGLNSFALANEEIEGEPNVSTQYPRLFSLAEGDVITTNCFALDGTHVTTLFGPTVTTSVQYLLGPTGNTSIYGGLGADALGYIVLDTTAPTDNIKFIVQELTTLPNGEDAVKLAVAKVF